MSELGAAELISAVSVVSLGAALQGSVGFGFALVAAPTLALIDPRFVPGPLLFAALILVLLLWVRERRAMDTTGFGWAFVGRVIGTGLGAALVAALPAQPMALALGGLVLLAVGISASGFEIVPTTRTLLAAGGLSGFMGTTSSIGGPPLALLYQKSSGALLRATLSAHFATGAGLSLLALAAVGRFAAEELRLAVVLLPGVGVGLALSAVTAPVFDRGYTRPAILVVSAGAAVALIARSVGCY